MKGGEKVDVKKTYLPLAFAPEGIRNTLHEEALMMTEVRNARHNLLSAVDEAVQMGIVPCGKIKAIFFDQLIMERVKELEKAVHDHVALIKEHNKKSDIEILLESEQADGKHADLFRMSDLR